MRTRYARPTLTISLVIVVVALMTAPAAADGVYHSQHIVLAPAGDYPLRSGFVENIHTNGPVNFAHENYVLNGAEPNASYEVFLLVHPDPECALMVAELHTASLATNVAGNGKADSVITPDMAPHDTTIFLRWELRSGGATVYQTGCSMVVLD